MHVFWGQIGFQIDFLQPRFWLGPALIGTTARHPGSAPRNAFAARKSGVSDPSVNRSWIWATSCLAAALGHAQSPETEGGAQFPE